MKKKIQNLIVAVLLSNSLLLQGMLSRIGPEARRRAALTTFRPSQLQRVRAFVAPQKQGLPPRIQSQQKTQTSWGDWLRDWWYGGPQPKVSASILVEKPSPFSGPWGQQRSFSTTPVQQASFWDKLKNITSDPYQKQKEIESSIESIVSNLESEFPTRLQIDKFQGLIEAHGGDYSILNTYKGQGWKGRSFFEIMVNRYLREAMNEYRPYNDIDTSALSRFYEMGGRLTPEEVEKFKNSVTLDWFMKEIKFDRNIGNLTLKELYSLLSQLVRVRNVLQAIHFDLPSDKADWNNVWKARKLLPSVAKMRDLSSITVNQLKKAPIRFLNVSSGSREDFDSSDIIKSLENLGYSFDDSNKQQVTE